MSICCFFGHRNAPDSIKPLLEKEIEHLIINGLADSFYVGNQGNFDMLVYSCLKKLSKKYCNYWCIPNLLSSTMIRKNISDEEVKKHLDEKVYKYIVDKKLKIYNTWWPPGYYVFFWFSI